MLVNFFYGLKQGGVPVSISEYLTLLQALEQGLAFANVDEFYQLARLCLVKDEKHYDRFDRAFAAYFNNLQTVDDVIEALIPDDWLRSEFLKSLSEEEKAKIESMGSLEKLLEQFKQRLAEQEKRHAGGNKWIGTGGTSPFGHSGYHPEGIRVGGESRNRRATKVWEKRTFKNLDDSQALETRNLQMALRKLREFARSGAHDELDLDDTIRATANNGGMLDVKMVPERHNAVKVLIFFDVGGSMDSHVELCEALFSACKSEFKHLHFFYFHNFIYNAVWQDNKRRWSETTDLYDVLHTFGRDYKVIFVGDASMSPYEVGAPYGSVELMNPEPGSVWMKRLTEHFSQVAWLNPVPEKHWPYTQSIGMIQELLEDRMFPLTIGGLEQGMKSLLA